MIGLAGAYLAHRPLTGALNVLLVAIATAMLLILLAAATQIPQRLTRGAEGVDLVVGAKGAPLQLILSSVYHLDQPTGNIPLESLDLLRADPAVARAAPLALGDNFRGYRIVGTDESFLALQGARLARGRVFAKPGEAVIGADMARETGAGLGQRFIGAHGFGEQGAGHDEHPYEVVGVLAPTGGPADRLILTSLESVWAAHGLHAEAREDEAHDHHDHAHEHDHAVEPKPAALQERPELEPEITAILVTYRSAAGAVRLPAMINRQTNLQAAVPAAETARLIALFGAGLAAAQALGWLLAGVAALAIFTALFAAAQARAGDLALLRVMGASRAQAMGAIMAEGLMLAGLGALLGAALAQGALWFAAEHFRALAELGFDPFHWSPAAGLIIAGVLALALLAALPPALRVYRADIVRALA